LSIVDNVTQSLADTFTQLASVENPELIVVGISTLFVTVQDTPCPKISEAKGGHFEHKL